MACCAGIVAAGEAGIGDLQADRGQERVAGSSARKSDPGRARDPGRDRREIGLAAGDQRRQAADALGPAQPVERVLDARASRAC